MKTYKPHEDLYKYFTDEERLRWAKNLRETDLKQCNNTMTTGEGTACCLHVWEVYEQNEGQWFGTIVEVNYPTGLENATILKSGIYPEDVKIASYKSAKGCLVSIKPDVLNDDHEFTFNEIADILEGKEVVKNG